MRYYIQVQGRVLLVNDNNILRLPTPDQVPFKVRPLAMMQVGKERVMWCEADRHEGPGWVYRDNLLTSKEGVEELAKLAAVRSYPRVIAGAALLNRGRVLLLKSNYGMAKGFWIMPGGFVEYSEHPEEAVRRETLEETGLKIGKMELLTVETDTFKDTGLHFVNLYYTGRATGRLKLQEEEIAEAGWFTPREALKVCKHPTNAKALKVLERRLKHG